jgi:SAM-dependent methyltransferase
MDRPDAQTATGKTTRRAILLRMGGAWWRKVRGVIRRYGVSGVPRQALEYVAKRIHRARDSGTRQLLDDRFDEEYGVETAGNVSVSSLDAPPDRVVHASPYQPIYPAPFMDLIRQLPIDFQEWTFVDFGSGKGRAVLLASEFPFQKVVGVEFSPSLHEIAQRNLGTYRSATQRCRNIELLCLDATAYEIPRTPAIFYLYNSFGKQVMAEVARNIDRSLQEAPRAAFVVYLMPEVRGVWEACKTLEPYPVIQPVWPTWHPPGHVAKVFVAKDSSGL